MKKRAILILFALILIINANAQDINDYENLKINTEISSSLILSKESSSSKIDYAYANLTFFPQENEFQKITYNIVTEPKAKEEIGNDYAYFRWDNPNQNKLEFKVYVQEDTKTNFKHITSKIDFPIKGNLDEFKSYLKSSETVTSNDPKIIQKANELAQGEDDLFKVVHKLGMWTKQNINYSLETLTAEVSQNASWVLENKFGVCDELTSLFVAMLRSLNIPARFVTGQSYTNLINDFGNHAWAEVYFPGYGWVAFDPTYGQLGYVDASHIKMKISLDVKDSDINYGWLSKNINVDSSGLDVKSKIKEKGNLFKEDIELKLELLKKDVGPGSYVPIKIDVKNLNNYYLPISIYINKAPVKVKDYLHELLLKPNEEKSTFFIIQVPKDLEPNFIYASEVGIKDNFNNSVSGILHFAYDENKYNLDEAQNIINQFKKEEEKIYSKNVDLKCSLDKDYYYDYETGKIFCDIENKGNTNLNNLNICYNKDCKIIGLNIVEKESLEFKFTPQDKEFLVTANNQDISKFFIINPNIIKTPNLTINNLVYQDNADYFDEIVVKFNLNVNSEIKNIEVKLNGKKIYDLKSFSNEKLLALNIKGYNLEENNNLEVSYQDKNNNLYSEKKEFIISIKKPFYIEYWWAILIFIILMIGMILRGKQRH